MHVQYRGEKANDNILTSKTASTLFVWVSKKGMDKTTKDKE